MATTAVTVATMKVAEVPQPGADFRVVERELPKPGAGQVRIKVQACGVCHSDVLTKEGLWPEFSIPGCQDMKWWASSIKWVRVYPRGTRVSALVSAGTVARTTRVPSAGAAIFAIAGI